MTESMRRQAVRVSVPATSANLGPGFDCLGLALGLLNTVELAATGNGVTIEIQGEGADSLPRDESNAVVRAALAVFERAGERPPGLRFSMENRIPPGSGLGSSAAALVGGVVAANALLGGPLSTEEMLRLAIRLEGHPDNVTAALLGGLTVSSQGPCGLITRRVEVADMQVVIALPAIRLSTGEQRAALPRQVPLKEAAANIGRAALVIEALRTGDFDLLGEAMCDHLHEPTRRKAITGYDEAVRAARNAGAAAVAISGAGPSLIAFAAGGHEAIGEAMAEAFREATGKPARVRVLPVEQHGAQVVTL